LRFTVEEVHLDSFFEFMFLFCLLNAARLYHDTKRGVLWFHTI